MITKLLCCIEKCREKRHREERKSGCKGCIRRKVKLVDLSRNGSENIFELKISLIGNNCNLVEVSTVLGALRLVFPHKQLCQTKNCFY